MFDPNHLPQTLTEADPKRVGGVVIGTAGLSDLGDVLARELKVEGTVGVDEQARKPYPFRVVGRLSVGKGSIDASDCAESDFAESLEIIAGPGRTSLKEVNAELIHRGQEPVRSILGIPSNCIDGRENDVTRAGNTVALARPKVPGGEALYMTDVLSILGRFEGMSMIERFTRVVEHKPDAASMHESCGMAGEGSAPVLTTLHDHFDELFAVAIEVTDGKLRLPAGGRDRILAGTAETIETIQSGGGSFNEAAMIDIVERTSGPDSVLRLKIDPNHPTHSHEESGLGILFGSDDEIILKEPVTKAENAANVFFFNGGYAEKVHRAYLGSFDEDTLDTARATGLCMTLAAVGTLGRNQYVGVIGNYDTMLRNAI